MGVGLKDKKTETIGGIQEGENPNIRVCLLSGADPGVGVGVGG